MKITYKNSLVALLMLATGISSCQKGDLQSSPNVAPESANVPPALILNHITGNLTPAYNSQHDVYKSCLAMLDTANTLIANLIAAQPGLSGTKVDAAGDIFGLTYQQWRKVINTYKLRILISLSKRADDNADL